MRRTALVAGALGLLATLALSPAALAQQSVTVNLAAQGGSGVSGTATLTAMGANQTQVVINVEPAGNPNMPVHIHSGSCANIGGVVHPLQNVMNGMSTTTVNAALSSVAGLPINLHKSSEQISVFVACGEIPAAAGAAAPAAQPASAGGPAVPLVAGVLALAGAGLAGAGLALRRRRGD